MWLEDGKGGKQTRWVTSEVLTVPAEKGGKEEHRSIILRVNPDEKHDTVHSKIIELEKASKDNPKGFRLELQPDGKVQKGETWFSKTPKQDTKPGAKNEEQRTWQYKIAAPDAKLEKSGEKTFRYELKDVPDGKPGAKTFRYEAVPDGKTYRYEIQNRIGEKLKASPSTSDRASDLEKKIDRLQREIEELKDVLKKNRSQLPATSSGSTGAR